MVLLALPCPHGWTPRSAGRVSSCLPALLHCRSAGRPAVEAVLVVPWVVLW